MDALDSLLEQITQAATDRGMDAYIVGSQAWVPPTHDQDGYWNDGRLLKLSPTDMRTRPLLEVELAGCLRLYKHRDLQLTREHKGRPLSTKWVLGFIEYNSALAKQLLADQQPPTEQPEVPHLPYTTEELDALHAERNLINCSCRGTHEDCPRCYGFGSYLVDGLGNRV